jgi:hypothetical protein
MLGNSFFAIRTVVSFVLPLCGIVLTQSAVLGQTDGKVVPARAELAPLDQPIAWMTEAKRNMSVVKDYSCYLVSQERVKGKLLEQNTIEMKVKSEPFSVYMRWLAPDKFKGQEVAFVAGKNNNKMRVKSNVLGSNIVGFVSIDPSDPRVLQHSRHTILEAGLATMIDQNLKHWQISRSVGKTKVTVGESTYNKRNCFRVEITALDAAAASYCYRTVIYMEKESKIPIRMENYDANNELIEMFSYADLRFNTDLRDEFFSK